MFADSEHEDVKMVRTVCQADLSVSSGHSRVQGPSFPRYYIYYATACYCGCRMKD